MADYETIRAGRIGTRTLQIDEGLRAYMNKVYSLMAVAMLVMLRIVQIRWTRTWAEKGGRARSTPTTVGTSGARRTA